MSEEYIKWTVGENIPLFLTVANLDGTGATGLTPQVAIRRHRDITGSMDGYYWNGTGSFTASVTFNTMTEVDATNNPGLYEYVFSQSLIQSQSLYNVYYKHTTAPVGFSSEYHSVSNLVTDASDLRVYESEPD